MPLVSEYLAGDRDLPNSDDNELDESKPELWPLFLPSHLTEDDRLLCHKGIAETEHTLWLAQVQDNLVDLRRLRRTLRNLRTYFRSNVVGEGNKAQTKSRTSESGVIVRINRAVLRYRLAYAALLALDPMGSWHKDYFELNDKDNRGPGKEVEERGVGDGRYAPSWIWMGSAGSQQEAGPPEHEVNETVRYEWMTSRARADRWKEESVLLQEEMRRVVAFLEWKSMWWSEQVGSRMGSITADVQHGVDAYARRQANTYHNLATSLVNKWVPQLIALNLSISWVKSYPWALKIISAANQPQDSSDSCKSSSSVVPFPPNSTLHGHSQGGAIELAGADSSGDETDHMDLPELEGDHDAGESNDGLGVAFEYNDVYMS